MDADRRVRAGKSRLLISPSAAQTTMLMARTTKWTDDYWLMIVQLYLQKPVGVKPVYSRPMVKLALELHIAPDVLHDKMCAVANLETPRIERIWQKYGSSPRRLARAVALLRRMNGFGNAEEFYSGVAVKETFERDFRPIEGLEGVMPFMLVLILDLYFRLTPPTMVALTPEVAALAKLMHVGTDVVVDAMAAFRHCDPYLHRKAPKDGPLLEACREIWHRYGNTDPTELAAYAAELREYFG